MIRPFRLCLLVALLLPLLTLARGMAAEGDTAELRNQYRRPATIPYPNTNPYTEAKAALGQRLFFDPRLSRDNDISCATCHQQAIGWEDGQKTAVGTDGLRHERHAQTLLDLAWSNALLWDGRTPTLESQVWFPLTAHDEMAQDVRELTEELAADSGYAEAFATVFPDRGIRLITISEAIATFERQIISPVSAFDRWVEGDESALSEQAKAGFELFTGKAGCAACHSGWNFTDGRFHDIGLPASEDTGRYRFSRNDSDRYAFKTPGLRGITRRAPYMHDGSLPSLEAVLDHFSSNFPQRTSLSAQLSRISLNDNERQALLAFLATLDTAP